MERPETKDQTFVPVSKNQFKAIIDVEVTDEHEAAPPLLTCRHAVLTIQSKDVNGNPCTGYVVYDRWLNRIVNGVYSHRNDALGSAYVYNTSDRSPQDMNPNGYALGLIYPDASQVEDDLAS